MIRGASIHRTHASSSVVSHARPRTSVLSVSCLKLGNRCVRRAYDMARRMVTVAMPTGKITDPVMERPRSARSREPREPRGDCSVTRHAVRITNPGHNADDNSTRAHTHTRIASWSANEPQHGHLARYASPSVRRSRSTLIGAHWRPSSPNA